jgi:hypothetical protein
MANDSASNIDWGRCRAHIEHEDGLLNQRTGLFLTANGLAAVAVGLIPSAALVLVVIVANILLVACRNPNGVRTSRSDDVLYCGSQ